MAYRYCASGTLEVSPRYLERVCSILSSKSIRYVREGNTIRIEHDEKASEPARQRHEEAFSDLARYIDKPQALTVYSELLGESEVGFVEGRVRTDKVEKVWATHGDPPTPDTLLEALRGRGIAATSVLLRGSRKSGRRYRVFEIRPGSGGPGCRVSVKRRFWDSYDLLSVPEIYKPLCAKYHLTPAQLRHDLHEAKFGLEVRNPALRNSSTDMLFENLLEVIEELTDGIRTELG
ncbi:MAG: hypothetical protein D6731_13085 [Planctomycetota bacterium]|nr:MAG: hypothetical protein D6731_13085 [Planctomycetota bacterium]